MKRIRYQVACSLDGYIAGTKGEYDWIVADPDIDFNALMQQFDTYLMGRHTYEMVPPGQMPGQQAVVVSRTLRQEDHPNVTIINDNLPQHLAELRSTEGKDIWLFGGGELFRSLLEIDEVDTVELAVIPIILGAGIPFLPAPAARKKLTLSSHHLYPKSGIMMLNYDVVRTPLKKKRPAKVAN